MVWQNAGGSAPCAKCPRSSHTVVGEGISHPLFLHFTQQYNSVQCRPTLRHSHAHSDGPEMEQVEGLVQQQHRSTCYRPPWKEG